jgi:hypothetical protein
MKLPPLTGKQRTLQKEDRGLPILSFCITSMNRLHHLRRTLPANLKWNSACPIAEFVVLDYSSSDGLAEWIRSEMYEHIESGTLVFAQAPGFTEFRRSHAKNMAHRIATGRYLCNLDADNYTGARFATYLIQHFLAVPKICVHSCRGLIAFPREYFYALGGYDERMIHGWGHEDWDLWVRSRAMGLKQVFIPGGEGFPYEIAHGDDERVKYHPVHNIGKSRAIHAEMSNASLKNNILVANAGQNWGAGRIIYNFSKTVEL